MFVDSFKAKFISVIRKFENVFQWKYVHQMIFLETIVKHKFLSCFLLQKLARNIVKFKCAIFLKL